MSGSTARSSPPIRTASGRGPRCPRASVLALTVCAARGRSGARSPAPHTALLSRKPEASSARTPRGAAPRNARRLRRSSRPVAPSEVSPLPFAFQSTSVGGSRSAGARRRCIARVRADAVQPAAVRVEPHRQLTVRPGVRNELLLRPVPASPTFQSSSSHGSTPSTCQPRCVVWSRSRERVVRGEERPAFFRGPDQANATRVACGTSPSTRPIWPCRRSRAGPTRC